MPRLRLILARITAMFRRGELDERIDDELRFHIDMQTEENVRRGMTPREARRQARIECGGVEQVKEMHRDARGFPFFESLFQDVRFALRSFRRDLGFTATVLITLALGIGVGTAVFAVVNAILLQSLPYKDPDRLVYIKRASEKGGIESQSHKFTGISPGDCSEWRDQSGLFESVVCINPNVAGMNDELIYVDFVGEGFCETIGVQPILGRCFRPGDLPPRFSCDMSWPVILQYQFWKTRFGGDPEVIGRTYASEGCGGSNTIIGVMPPEFVFRSLQNMAFYPQPPRRSSHNAFTMRAIGRLMPGLHWSRRRPGRKSSRGEWPNRIPRRTRVGDTI